MQLYLSRKNAIVKITQTQKQNAERKASAEKGRKQDGICIRTCNHDCRDRRCGDHSCHSGERLCEGAAGYRIYYFRFQKGQRILIGKAGIKLPFFERLDKLSLKLVAIDVKTSDAVPTADYINIQVDAAVNIKVGDEPQKLQKASQNFLNRDSEYIAKVAREVLEGNMREIVGKMRLEEMVSDRQKFAELVKENAEPDLAAMGLDIISFNVQNFVDSNQVIENLGIDNIVKIKKSAAIARANSEKEIKIAQARANKEANDERVLAETEIAKKNNDLAIKSAELKKSPISKRQRQMQRTKFRKSSREKSWKSLPRMRTSPVRSVRLSSVPEK